MRRIVKLFVSVILMTSILLGTCSCDFFDKIQTGSSQSVSEAELARLMVSAINEDISIADVYESVPEQQRNGLSFSYFTAYIDILRHLTASCGKVTSFLLDENNPELEQFSGLGYGDIDMIRLECANQKEHNDPVIYLSKNSEGVAYIDSRWVMDTISIYNYIQHYYEMLDQQNIDALIALLSPYYSDDVYTEAVLLSMASELSSYYLVKVKGNSKTFELLEVNPLLVSYLEPKVVDVDNETIGSRTVSAIKSETGVYFIDDIIPVVADSNLAYLYRNEGRILKVGTSYTSGSIYSSLGEPQSFFVGSTVLDTRVSEYGVVEYKKKVQLTYYGMTLNFEAFITRQGDGLPEFEGEISSISYYLPNSGFSSGSRLYVGMSESDVLELYPFLENDGYILHGTTTGDNFSVSITFTDGVVSKIKVHLS